MIVAKTNQTSSIRFTVKATNIRWFNQKCAYVGSCSCDSYFAIFAMHFIIVLHFSNLKQRFKN